MDRCHPALAGGSIPVLHSCNADRKRGFRCSALSASYYSTFRLCLRGPRDDVVEASGRLGRLPRYSSAIWANLGYYGVVDWC